MGMNRIQVLLFSWNDYDIFPEYACNEILALAEEAFKEAAGLRLEDGSELEDFTKRFTGQMAGINGNCAAAFFSTGSKIGWVADRAFDILERLVEERLDKKIQAVSVSMWHEMGNQHATITMNSTAQ